jgi:hydroxypyruvate isomerase
MSSAERIRYYVSCSMLFTELPLLERPAAARRAGFGAVEFWWPFAQAEPSSSEIEAFIISIREAGVRLIGLNFIAGDMPSGDRGLVSWPGRSSEFRTSVQVARMIGCELGYQSYNALYGNRLAGANPVEQDSLALENLSYAAKEVAKIGGTVLIEVVSGSDNYPIRRPLLRSRSLIM